MMALIDCGWVRLKRSFVARRSRGQSAKRSPGNRFAEFVLLDHRAHGAVEHQILSSAAD